MTTAMTTARNVTVIPATITLQQGLNRNLLIEHLLRVTGYARVSTDDPEQMTSCEAQLDYYKKLIQTNANWQFVEVYADDGTQKRHQGAKKFCPRICNKYRRSGLGSFRRCPAVR